MYERQEGRNPVLDAPGSNNHSGLIASSTYENSGSIVSNFQGLSEEETNNLCERYLPLAYKTAGKYRDKGIDDDRLRSAALTGLFWASRGYNPQCGSFGAYAKPWIKGEVTALFKKEKKHRAQSLDDPAFKKDEDAERILNRFVADEATPALTPDTSALTEKEERVVLGRVAGETLSETGKALNLSAERVRQIEARAHTKLRKTKDSYPLGVAPRDADARSFRDEYSACKGMVGVLARRKGYRRPTRELPPFRSVRYPCHRLSKEDIEAFKPQECLPPPNVLPPLWAPPSSPSIPYHPPVEIKRGDGRWCPLKRSGELSRSEADARAIVKALQLNKYVRLPIPREPKPALETERFRNEGLRQLNGVSDNYEPKLSKEAGHHRTHASQLAALRGNYPLRNPKGPFGGPVIHAWGHA
jgi:RNA polymerase sigma factor (sigma-70 family)